MIDWDVFLNTVTNVIWTAMIVLGWEVAKDIYREMTKW